MDTLLEGLNDAQKDAVTSPASVLQVLAPPGSGKTKTLTARVAYLINHDRLQPWNIIVCTFTIKASREMKERIRGFVGEGVEAKLILGTFHSVARRFLVRYGHFIGIEKNFGIADSSDSLAIIKRIVKRHSYSVEPSVARSRISGLKSKGTSAQHFAATTKKIEQHEFACVYQEYEDTLKSSNLLDYDDLLLRCTDLLRTNPECVSSIQAVLIDEYQDTNNVQYELMVLLAQQKKRITIVGDPDQSIYGFRSAEIKNLHRMRKDYPESIVINLENNYRSSACILNSALALIEQDENRHKKPLLSTLAIGERPVLRLLSSAATEAKWLVSEIQRSKTLTAGLLDFNDYSILLRSAALSRHIETALGKAGIPYRMVGGRRFFDRAEVKVVLDYLRVINQPEHNDALVRIINVPPRKIGEVTVKNLLEEAEAKKISLWKLILTSAQGNGRPETKLSAQAEKGLEILVNLILTSRKKLLNLGDEGCNLIDLISHVLNRLSFQEFLKRTHPEDWEGRWANVEELVAQATDIAATGGPEDEAEEDALPIVEGVDQREYSAEDILSRFLSNVALSTAIEQAQGQEVAQVTISTIHAAKGLEWPVVFIPAVYEGSLPHSRSEDNDEERRLLYVGMTRAKGLLFLSSPVRSSTQEQTILSRFVSSSKMRRYFQEKGPSISAGVTEALAKILRRELECPSSDVLREARRLVDRLEDNLYPLDGSDLDPEDKYWDQTLPSNETTYPSYLPSKRRRTEPGTGVSSMCTSVTMQNSASYSVASTTLPSGFMNARVHAQVLEQEAENARMLSFAKEIASLNSRQISENGNRQKLSSALPGKVTTTKKRQAGQGSITNFFARSNTVPTSVSALPPRTTTSSLARPSSFSLTQHHPLNEVSNLRPGFDSAAPPASSRKPLAAPMAGKPRRPEHDDMSSKRHVLLSSSPAKPEEPQNIPDSDPEAGEDDEVPPISPTKTVLGTAAVGFRPASTFHTTSMAHIQGPSNPQRKTLGMRRSVQGWSVKNHQPPRPR